MCLQGDGGMYCEYPNPSIVYIRNFCASGDSIGSVVGITSSKVAQNTAQTKVVNLISVPIESSPCDLATHPKEIQIKECPASDPSSTQKSTRGAQLDAVQVLSTLPNC